MPFDANDPKYFHNMCVGAHVTKAARWIAVFSLVSYVLRTIFFLETKYEEWDIPITVIWIADLCCIAALLVGVFRDIRWLVIPYLLDQMLSIVMMIYACYAVITEPPGTTEEDIDHTEELKIFTISMGAVIIACKIILNYFFFLSARNSHRELSGTASVSYHSSSKRCPPKHSEVPALEAGQRPPPYEK
uniref:Transmembrane protein n=1 Tax=Pristionchus pacificus TaxID=54126 RepID=A0A8R1Y7M7_PRIPA